MSSSLDESDNGRPSPSSAITIRPPALALPAEMVLEILGNLTNEKDWFSLACTCRHYARIVVPELDKNYDSEEPYAFVFALEHNNPVMLKKYITLDPTLANRHFDSNQFTRLHASDWISMTPLSVAAYYGHPSLVKTLLLNGADPHIPDKPACIAFCALWYPINHAIQKSTRRSLSVLKLLIKYHGNTKPTPFYHPDRRHVLSECFCGCICDTYREPIPIFRVLKLDRVGINYYRAKERSPSNWGTCYGSIKYALTIRHEQLKLLLESGVDVNGQHPVTGKSPLYSLLVGLAQCLPCPPERRWVDCGGPYLVIEKVHMFLDTMKEFGLNIHEVAPWGNAPAGTPLHAVVRLPDDVKPIMHWFLANGAGIDALDAMGNTPLMVYCASDEMIDVGMLNEFCDCGPDLNRQGCDGNTALHYLSSATGPRWGRREQAARLLLRRGANPLITNDAGSMPLHMVNLESPFVSDYFRELLEATEQRAEKLQRKKQKAPRYKGYCSKLDLRYPGRDWEKFPWQNHGYHVEEDPGDTAGHVYEEESIAFTNHRGDISGPRDTGSESLSNANLTHLPSTSGGQERPNKSRNGRGNKKTRHVAFENKGRNSSSSHAWDTNGWSNTNGNQEAIDHGNETWFSNNIRPQDNHEDGSSNRTQGIDNNNPPRGKSRKKRGKSNTGRTQTNANHVDGNGQRGDNRAGSRQSPYFNNNRRHNAKGKALSNDQPGNNFAGNQGNNLSNNDRGNNAEAGALEATDPEIYVGSTQTTQENGEGANQSIKSANQHPRRKNNQLWRRKKTRNSNNTSPRTNAGNPQAEATANGIDS